MDFNKELLKPVHQEFINTNLTTDLNRLLLSKSEVQNVDIISLVKQIESKKKAKSKLPTWYNSPSIYYPDKLNIEQTSSEKTALYKSSLVMGETLFDATAGFGVDLYYFSKRIRKITACETNEVLVQIIKHNFKQLKVNNITVLHEDGMDFLKYTDKVFDWIYIDPSRRDKVKGKIFRFMDSQPNVKENLALILKKSKNIMIKSSPLMDINLGIKELEEVAEIHVIAVENEVKELLWILKKNRARPLIIKTSNLLKNKVEKFDFVKEHEQDTKAELSLPLKYLYEPNSAILKSGAFKIICKSFRVTKLHQHTHLYTSLEKINFPGRTFKILDLLEYNKKLLKKLLPKKANITIRNFPISVSELRTEFKIIEGGSHYLLFTTNLENKKIVIICEKN